MKSSLDRSMDVISKKMDTVRNHLSKQYKNVQPYQSVKVSDEELVANWLSYPDEVKMKLREENPGAYQTHENKINEIILKRRQDDTKEYI
jgi:hypothetical protein